MRALAVTTALTAALSSMPAVAAEEPVPHLPDPTGRHRIGITSVYLNDTSRPDPWVSGVDSRELMVSLFYPALPGHGPTNRYLTPAESGALLADGGITTVPPGVLSTVRTNAVVDARPSGRRHSRPLVVLSPGFKKPRATLSSLAEDLASHGHVVAVIDHTYENVATTFPDGRVTGCAACGHYDLPFWRKLARGRAADVSFVLDELTGPHPKWRGARLIDPRRIAMGGHSVGGASAVDAMLADRRILAGIDVDGTLDAPIPHPGLGRPFLFLGRANTYTPGTPGAAVESWEQNWPRLTGWRRWLVVAGMEHASFTDIGVLAGQLGLDIGADTGGDRGAAITRAYVRAFFDLHLRGERQPLLERPSSRFPEVTVVGPRKSAR